MNLNPVNLLGRAQRSTSQAAANSRLVREILRLVITGSMIMIAVTLWQTFDFIRESKVDTAVGILLGTIFTFFGGVIAVAIPALISAHKSKDNGQGTPSTPTTDGEAA